MHIRCFLLEHDLRFCYGLWSNLASDGMPLMLHCGIQKSKCDPCGFQPVGEIIIFTCSQCKVFVHTPKLVEPRLVNSPTEEEGLILAGKIEICPITLRISASSIRTKGLHSTQHDVGWGDRIDQFVDDIACVAAFSILENDDIAGGLFHAVIDDNGLITILSGGRSVQPEILQRERPQLSTEIRCFLIETIINYDNFVSTNSLLHKTFES